MKTMKKPISLRMDLDQLEQLRARCAASGKPVAQLIRESIELSLVLRKSAEERGITMAELLHEILEQGLKEMKS